MSIANAGIRERPMPTSTMASGARDLQKLGGHNTLGEMQGPGARSSVILALVLLDKLAAESRDLAPRPTPEPTVPPPRRTGT